MRRILCIIVNFTLTLILLSGCSTAENEKVNIDNTFEATEVSTSAEEYIRNNLSDDKKCMVADIFVYASHKEAKKVNFTIYVEKADGQFIPPIAEDIYQLATNSIENTDYSLDKVQVTELIKNNADEVEDVVNWIFESEDTGILFQRSCVAKRLTIDELFEYFDVDRKKI